LRSAGRSADLGGNIGTPVLTLKPPRADHAHVVECSSYQIDLAPTLDPRVGLLINVSEDHLDRHGTLEHYAAVKERLVAGVQTGGAAVIGVDDEWCAAAADRVVAMGKKVVRISVRLRLADGIYAENGELSAPPAARRNRSRNSTTSVRCAGCTTRRMRLVLLRRRSRSVSMRRRFSKACVRFPGLAHRMEQVGRKGPVLFRQRFQGDQRGFRGPGAGLVHRHVLDRRRQTQDRRHHLAGKILPAHPQSLSDRRGGADFARTLDGKVAYEMAETLDRAVSAAAADAEGSGLKEPVVLLSPACASFDQYRNFEVRGDRFRDLVLALPGVASNPVATPKPPDFSEIARINILATMARQD